MPRPHPPRTIGAEQNLARRIRQERTRRHWTYDTLADRMAEVGCPIGGSGLWKIECGNPPRRIHVNEAIALAAVFEMGIGELLRTATDEPVTPLVIIARMLGVIEVLHEHLRLPATETVIREARAALGFDPAEAH